MTNKNNLPPIQRPTRHVSPAPHTGLHSSGSPPSAKEMSEPTQSLKRNPHIPLQQNYYFQGFGVLPSGLNPMKPKEKRKKNGHTGNYPLAPSKMVLEDGRSARLRAANPRKWVTKCCQVGRGIFSIHGCGIYLHFGCPHRSIIEMINIFTQFFSFYLFSR